MEDMNNPSGGIQPPPTPPMGVDPNTPPPPAPPAPPPPPANPPSFEQGGKTGANFFDGIKLVDIGYIALSTVGILVIIRYYTLKIQQIKKEQPEMKKKLEELEVNVMNAVGPNYKKF